jgi:hypothetical protein
MKFAEKKMMCLIIILLVLSKATPTQAPQPMEIALNSAYTGSEILRFTGVYRFKYLIAWDSVTKTNEAKSQIPGHCLVSFWWDSSDDHFFAKLAISRFACEKFLFVVMAGTYDQMMTQVMPTYISEDGFFTWNVLVKGEDRLKPWKKTSVDLYKAGALDKEIDHDVQMLVNDRMDLSVFFLYQKAGNNGTYPKVFYRLNTDVRSKQFNYSSTITLGTTKIPPQNVFSELFPMQTVDHMNFVSMGKGKTTSGLWGSFIPGTASEAQQAVYQTWYYTIQTTNYAHDFSTWGNYKAIFELNGFGGGRMYAGSIPLDTNFNPDRNYLINLDTGDYKTCLGYENYYNSNTNENHLYYQNCYTGNLEGGISKDQFIRDVNFNKAQLGVYNLVNRENGKLSSWIMNPKKLALPELDLSKSLAAVNLNYLVWVDLELGSDPVMKMLKYRVGDSSSSVSGLFEKNNEEISSLVKEDDRYQEIGKNKRNLIFSIFE